MIQMRWFEKIDGTKLLQFRKFYDENHSTEWKTVETIYEESPISIKPIKQAIQPKPEQT